MRKLLLGFCMMLCILLAASFPVRAENVEDPQWMYIYREPWGTEKILDSPRGKIIDEIPRGTPVRMLREEGHWTKIDYRGLVGYVKSEALKDYPTNATKIYSEECKLHFPEATWDELLDTSGQNKSWITLIDIDIKHKNVEVFVGDILVAHSPIASGSGTWDGEFKVWKRKVKKNDGIFLWPFSKNSSCMIRTDNGPDLLASEKRQPGDKGFFHENICDDAIYFPLNLGFFVTQYSNSETVVDIHY